MQSIGPHRRVGIFALAVAGLLELEPFGLAPAGAETPRDLQPLVLTGADLPGLAAPAAKAIEANPQGNTDADVFDRHADETDTLWVIPPSPNPAVLPGQLFVFRWNGTDFEQIPFQVDERFERYLRVGPFINGPDARAAQGVPGGPNRMAGLELTYSFDVEPWRKTAGICEAEFRDPARTTTSDPASAFDTDDEIVFLYRDAGPRAPAEAAWPAGVGARRHEVKVIDPLDRGASRWVYVYTSETLTPAFTAANGYVSYERDPDADRYEAALGPNPNSNLPSGPVCDESGAVIADDVPRGPRDGATVATSRYRFRYEGRWLLTGLQVAASSGYGPDLLDHFKGRTLSTSNDANTGVGAFEDEHWWNNTSVLFGERVGPVRAIRELWGAASGYNVTATQLFYPELIEHRLFYRVHPIAGVYVFWDYNRGAVTTYFNALHPIGVAIDGRDDEIAGNVDLDVGGKRQSFDVPDPTQSGISPFETWEEVEGPAGALVYTLENLTPQFPGLVLPYYRDDACFDDGTGDDPGPARSGLSCGERQGAFGNHGIEIGNGETNNEHVPSSYDNGEFLWSQFVLGPGAGNVGESFVAAKRAPLRVVARAEER